MTALPSEAKLCCLRRSSSLLPPLADLKGMGMPGMSMYNRDELKDQLENMYGEDGDSHAALSC